jgi:hypothetical protein
MKRPTHKALGLILPLASCMERQRIANLVDDRPATAGVHLKMTTTQRLCRPLCLAIPCRT